MLRKATPSESFAAQAQPLLPVRSSILGAVLTEPPGGLRAITLRSLLLEHARLFANRGELARLDPSGTYARSRQVRALHYFCSHSWGTSRWYKYLALLVHFNLLPACAAAVAVNILLFSVQLLYFEWLPGWATAPQPIVVDFTQSEMGLLCETFVPVAFLAVLFCAHRCLPYTRTNVFVDACCIVQDDPEAKAQGIASLGTTLAHSERMLALCDGEYFTRLWCLFELAAFSRRAGSGRLDMVALHAPIILTTCSVFSLLIYGIQTIAFIAFPALASAVAASHVTMMGWWMLIAMPLCFPCFWAFQEAERITSSLRSLHHFTLGDARCTVPEDQHALSELIAVMWSRGVDPSVTTRESGSAGYCKYDGTQQFEAYIRYELAPRLLNSISSAGIGLQEYGVIWLLLVGGFVLDSIAMPDTSITHMIGFITFGALCVLSTPLLVGSFSLGRAVMRHVSASRYFSGSTCTHSGSCCGVVGCLPESYGAWLIGGIAGGSTCLLAQAAVILGTAVLTFPTKFLAWEPEYHLPSDGLDRVTRKLIKFWIVLLLHCVAVLALVLAYRLQRRSTL